MSKKQLVNQLYTDDGTQTWLMLKLLPFPKDWKEKYSPVASALGKFPSEKIVWISMGTVRYPPELKEKMGDRPYLYDEFVRSRDGKFRYLQVKRIEIYSELSRGRSRVYCQNFMHILSNHLLTK